MKQDLRIYVEVKLKVLCPKTSDYGRDLLTEALKMHDQFEHHQVTPAGIYELLLTVPWEDGPNQMYRGNSPWQQFLTEVHTYAAQDWMNEDYLKQLAHVFKVMLDHGANPQTTCMKNHSIEKDSIEAYWITKDSIKTGQRSVAVGCHTVKHVIIDVFKRFLPGECADLMELVEEMIEGRRKQQKSQRTPSMRKRVAMDAPSRQTVKKRR